MIYSENIKDTCPYGIYVKLINIAKKYVDCELSGNFIVCIEFFVIAELRTSVQQKVVLTLI